jgi:hypothetical protein
VIEKGGEKMERKMIKILQVLDRASCYCPLGYISMHTNIVEPLKLLEALEEEGYVCRCKPDEWSPSGHPMFEITPKARQELRQIEADIIQIPLRVVAEKLVHD